MPNTTSRLALQEPVGADAASELRLAITNHATTLDNAALYTEGTLAARPAVGAVEHGHLYLATDTGSLFLNTGSAWLLVAVPDTGWVTFPATAGWTQTNAAYRVIGDRAFFRGTLQSAGTANPICTLPSIARPAAQRNVLCAAQTGASPFFIAFLGVSTGGVLTVAAPIINSGDDLFLDGVSYPLG